MSTAVPILLIVLLVIVGALVIAAIWGVGIYNSLVALRNACKNAFAQVDVQLKRRHDQIPNLVETTKGYLKHERGTLEAVIAARNSAYSANNKVSGNPGDPEAMKALSNAEGALGASLGKLFALTEAYPDLKANMEELTSTENKVSFARQAYNDSVMGYNTAREVFPTNIIAGMFNFGPAESFKVEVPEQREAVKVTF